ncbi:MAG TPA: hypothetical protein PKG57_17125, partial [Flavobacteriales bacterium]|nr:hypothetical protein [Flavobacteriales bacterium]
MVDHHEVEQFSGWFNRAFSTARSYRQVVPERMDREGSILVGGRTTAVVQSITEPGYFRTLSTSHIPLSERILILDHGSQYTQLI